MKKKRMSTLALVCTGLTVIMALVAVSRVLDSRHRLKERNRNHRASSFFCAISTRFWGFHLRDSKQPDLPLVSKHCPGLGSNYIFFYFLCFNVRLCSLPS